MASYLNNLIFNMFFLQKNINKKSFLTGFFCCFFGGFKHVFFGPIKRQPRLQLLLLLLLLPTSPCDASNFVAVAKAVKADRLDMHYSDCTAEVIAAQPQEWRPTSF